MSDMQIATLAMAGLALAVAVAQQRPEPPRQAAAMVAPVASPDWRAEYNHAAQVECLAVMAYHEARGDGVEGMAAVIDTALVRAADRRWPMTPCGVVYQPQQYAGMALADRPVREPASMSLARRLAAEAMAPGYTPRRAHDHFRTVRGGDTLADGTPRVCSGPKFAGHEIIGSHVFCKAAW